MMFYPGHVFYSFMYFFDCLDWWLLESSWDWTPITVPITVHPVHFYTLTSCSFLHMNRMSMWGRSVWESCFRFLCGRHDCWVGGELVSKAKEKWTRRGKLQIQMAETSFICWVSGLLESSDIWTGLRVWLQAFHIKRSWVRWFIHLSVKRPWDGSKFA